MRAWFSAIGGDEWTWYWQYILHLHVWLAENSCKQFLLYPCPNLPINMKVAHRKIVEIIVSSLTWHLTSALDSNAAREMRNAKFIQGPSRSTIVGHAFKLQAMSSSSCKFEWNALCLAYKPMRDSSSSSSTGYGVSNCRLPDSEQEIFLPFKGKIIQ